MFSTASFALFAFALGARAAINVSTPSDGTQCQSLSFTASGDTPGPYFAYVMKSTEPCGTPVSSEIDVDTTTGAFKWTPTDAGAYVVVVENQDASVEGWSSSFNVASAGTSGCTQANSNPTTISASHTSTASGARLGTTAPANAAPSTLGDVAADNETGGASRTAVGGVSALAFIGAVAAVLSI